MVDTNGVKLAVYEQGNGSPVLFLHGFPELAYSWRHQLGAMASGGFRAIAMDQRGYGRSTIPTSVSDYTMAKLVGDALGVLDALDIERATVVGHDWGALIAWNMAMRAQDRVKRLVALNIPHYPRPPIDPIDIFRQRYGDDYYIVNFQDNDVADRTFAADPTHFFNAVMRKGQITRAQFARRPPAQQGLSLLKTFARNELSGEPLLSDAERQVYIDAFTKSGFTGAINWYRNFSVNWHESATLDHHIHVPTLFIGAVDDVLIGDNVAIGIDNDTGTKIGFSSILLTPFELIAKELAKNGVIE